MDMIKSIFQRKEVNFEKLTAYGFSMNDDGYSYHKTLQSSAFEMTVKISNQGKVEAAVIDPAFQGPYTLHLADGAEGEFIIGVRNEYEKILTNIAENCFDVAIFKTKQARELIACVRQTYGDELEYLWEKFPDNAVWRRKDNQKWYGALLTVASRKLGINSDEIIEIVDLRIQPEKMESLIDNRCYFPGWHMNKKNWYTMILNDSVPLEELCQRMRESYLLAAK